MSIEIEDVQKLYKKICLINVDYLFFHNKNIIKEVRIILPDLNTFVKSILLEENFLYEKEQEEILSMIQDCVQAIEQEDQVLMYDTMEYGFIKVIKRILDQEEERDLHE